ncbi:MAG: tetratricopeptide repeat protein [Deltaproteobacteria bacterium]|nr:tetratricopeptide repeat protein [Deltaproteobacteria bacterium]
MNPNPAPESQKPVPLMEQLRDWLSQQQMDPQNHIPPYQCGIIFTKLELHDEAVTSYLAALQRNPRFYQAYFNMGGAYVAQGLFQDAEDSFRHALELNPEDAEIWANLGAVQETLGRMEEARASYNRAITLDPSEWNACQRLGTLLLSQGDQTRGMALLRQAAETAPDQPAVHNALGAARFHHGDLEEAERCYNKALQLNPNHAETWNNLANLKASRKDEQGALQAYQRAVALAPNNADYQFNLGEFHFQHNHREAERALLKAVDLNRHDQEAWDLLRQWYQRHPNDERHKSVVRAMLQFHPDDPDLLMEGAEVCERARDFKSAIEYLRILRRQSPESSAVGLAIARVHLKEGLLDEALKDIQAVTDDSPHVLDFRVSLTQSLLRHGRFMEAEAVVLPVSEKRPEVPDLWQFLGETALVREENDLALERFERAAPVNQNDRTIWLPLAKRFIEQDDHRSAARCLSHLEELLRFLPGLWLQFYETYEKAGQGREFLQRLERLIELNLVAPREWLRLGELYDQAGDREKGAECKTNAPAGADLSQDKGNNLWHWAAPEVRDFFGNARQYLGIEDGALMAQSTPVRPAPKIVRDLSQTVPVEVESPLPEPGAPLQPARPNDPESWLTLAVRLQAAGRLQDAETVLRESLRRSDKSFQTWFRLGSLYFSQDRYSEAAQAFTHATRLDHRSVKAWYNLAVCRAEEGREVQARAAFESVLDLDDRFAKAWDWLGILHMRAGETEKALGSLLRSVECDPNLAIGWHNLGMLYRSMDRTADAEECLKRASDLGGPESMGSLGAMNISKTPPTKNSAGR